MSSEWKPLESVLEKVNELIKDTGFGRREVSKPGGKILSGWQGVETVLEPPTGIMEGWG